MQRLTLPRKFLRLDWFLLLVVLALTTFGVMCIFSATNLSENAAMRSSFERHILFACVGLAAALALAIIDYERWLRLGWAFLVAGLALLVATLVFAKEDVNGARAWIQVGGTTVQPTEFAKLAYILFIAWFLARFGRHLPDWLRVGIVCGVMGLFILLIYKQNDLGSSLVFLPITAFLLFASGLPKRWFLLGAIVGLLLGWLAFVFVLKPHHVTRLTIWMHPEADAQGAGYHTIQSAISIAEGGMWGKGFQNGTRNYLGFMPRGTAHSDFIFAQIGEEFGFIGGCSVILAQTLLLLLGLRIAARARDSFGLLAATGITGMLFAHMLENIAMTIQAAPVTGIPLPFVSYGGSFLLTCFLAVGLLLSIHVHRHAFNNWEPER